jgi:hypothetical protein
MFAALRRLLGRFVVVLCACSVLLPATLEGHALSGSDDTGCRASVSSPVDRLPHIAAASGPFSATHCVICHWLRAIDGALPSDGASTPSPLAMRDVAVARLVWWHDEMLPLERPARAPPQSFLR